MQRRWWQLETGEGFLLVLFVCGGLTWTLIALFAEFGLAPAQGSPGPLRIILELPLYAGIALALLFERTDLLSVIGPPFLLLLTGALLGLLAGLLAVAHLRRTG